MDNTEQYIRMSVQAWSDLKRALEYDDIVYSPSRELVGRVGYSLDGEAKAKLSVTRWQTCILVDADDWVVLLQQDQLQEMFARYEIQELGLAEWDRTQIMHAFICLSAWLNEQYYDEEFVCLPTNVFGSGEQLWLAFTMQEKYSKTWNGEGWVEK